MAGALLPLFAAAQPAPIELCSNCHGARGEGNAAVGAPRLAGQPAHYLARQLDGYADGRRGHPVMSPIAKGLSPEQRATLAVFYSEQSVPAKPATGSSTSARGQVLAAKGDEARRVQGCANCHGPGGIGFGGVTPYLAGLDRRYLDAALREWREGKRRTDPSLQMNQIGKNLSDSDIKALAAYYASQRSPPPSAGRERTEARGASGQQGPGTPPQR
jgi:cytochrome c553